MPASSPTSNSINQLTGTRLSFPVYQDYSTKDDVWVENQLISRQQARKTSGGAKSHFPLMLIHMLNAVEDVGLSHIVGWLPHGRAFKIYDRDVFENRILPHYFANQSEISSFQRQLCLYGFLRLVGKHSDQHAYYHEYFLRGRIDLCRLIHRPQITPSKRRRVYDPKSEPNLNSFPPLPTTSLVRVVSEPSTPMRHVPSGDFDVQRLRTMSNCRISPLQMDQSCLVWPLQLPSTEPFVGFKATSTLIAPCYQGPLRSKRMFQATDIDEAGMTTDDHAGQPLLVEQDQSDIDTSSNFSWNVFRSLRPNCRSSSSTVVADEREWGGIRDNLFHVFPQSVKGVYQSSSSAEAAASISMRQRRRHHQPPRIAILGLTEYLETFRDTPMVDDQSSILSETDISCLTAYESGGLWTVDTKEYAPVVDPYWSSHSPPERRPPASRG